MCVNSRAYDERWAVSYKGKVAEAMFWSSRPQRKYPGDRGLVDKRHLWHTSAEGSRLSFSISFPVGTPDQAGALCGKQEEPHRH